MCSAARISSVFPFVSETTVWSCVLDCSAMKKLYITIRCFGKYRDDYLRESRLILKISYLNVILCYRGTLVLLQQDSCQSDRRLYKIYGPSRIGLIKMSEFSIYIILILLKKQKLLHLWCISAAWIWIAHIFWEENFKETCTDAQNDKHYQHFRQGTWPQI